MPINNSAFSNFTFTVIGINDDDECSNATHLPILSNYGASLFLENILSTKTRSYVATHKYPFVFTTSGPIVFHILMEYNK